MSAAGQDVFGYRPDELVGRNLLELAFPSEGSESREILKKVLATPVTPLGLDLPLRHRLGRRCSTRSTISNLLGVAGVGAIVITCRDTSLERVAKGLERRQFQEVLRAN